jgi:endonuclease/exonuclease/phosphatase family metal-dependent hydrolase
MPSPLKLASWNIAGGHTIRSNERFDYEPNEDANYFIDRLKALNMDVVCLQESHYHPEKSLSQRIASALGFQYVFETVNSPSGIDPEYKESTAILSRKPIENERAFCLPYPTFDLFLPDGSPAARWDKFLQTCTIDGVLIGNIHTQPLGYFKYDYHRGAGATYAKELERLLLKHLCKNFILAGDFNTTEADGVYATLYSENQLIDSLSSRQPTRPNGKHIDYILLTPNITKIRSGIIDTKTDHYLCWTELSINTT